MNVVYVNTMKIVRLIKLYYSRRIGSCERDQDCEEFMVNGGIRLLTHQQ
jgi:hypothetical protein